MFLGALVSRAHHASFGGITATLQASSFESLADRTVRILDATTISEPGSTGTDWRLHYSLRLPEMKCDFFELTDAKGGESVRRPPIHEGDIFLLDRGYNDRKAIAGVLRTKADVVLRWHSQAFPLMDGQGRAFPLLSKIRKLRIGEIGEYAAWFKHGTESLPMRVCVLRKSNEAALRSERKARHKARSSKTVRPQTIELTQYLVVLTSLPAAVITSRVVLECYRARWQVELAFKRLKSLLELGQLPKKKAASSIAWMQGKIFCALMIERILCEARSLSPWGYRLR